MPSPRSSRPRQVSLDWTPPGLVAGVDEAGRGPLAGPVFAAAVILSGLTDLADYLRRRPEMEERVFAKLVPDYRADREAAILRRSPIRWPEKLCKTTPILMLHGGADWRVHPTQALRMATALYDAKHPFRFAFFEGADHGLAEVSAEAMRMSYDWLDRYLRDRTPWPSLEPHGL